MNYFRSRGGEDRLLKEFSLNEFAGIASAYKSLFKE
jgi:hypothetical protein